MTTRSPKPSDRVRQKAGRVTLVGAGPGDPELLTLKAVRAMQEADVILFDALVSKEILAFARTSAKRMLVGKRGHRPSCRQEDINTLMLKLAKQGKHVVRLKCGDAMLFGRAGDADGLRRRFADAGKRARSPGAFPCQIWTVGNGVECRLAAVDCGCAGAVAFALAARAHPGIAARARMVIAPSYTIRSLKGRSRVNWVARRKGRWHKGQPYCLPWIIFRQTRA